MCLPSQNAQPPSHLLLRFHHGLQGRLLFPTLVRGVTNLWGKMPAGTTTANTCKHKVLQNTIKYGKYQICLCPRMHCNDRWLGLLSMLKFSSSKPNRSFTRRRTSLSGHTSRMSWTLLHLFSHNIKQEVSYHRNTVSLFHTPKSPWKLRYDPCLKIRNPKQHRLARVSQVY